MANAQRRSPHAAWAVLLATILGSGIVFLDGAVVNLALPDIARTMHASFADLQWVVDGYLLALASLILLGGSLGDIFDRKRVYLVGLAGFGGMSLLCGLAPNIGALIGFRIAQGVFGALLVPEALAIIDTTFAPDARGQAIGRWAAWSGVASAVGPIVGGYLIDAASWRWIFFLNVPFTIACFWLASVYIPDTSRRRDRHVDLPGATLAAVALSGITFGLIEGPAHHWRASATMALAVGAMAAVLFLGLEARRRDPMVPLRLFRSRNFSSANLTTFALYGALSGFFFALVIYLQRTMGYSSIKAGLSLLPATLLLLTLSGRIGKLGSSIGPRLFMTFGPLLAAGGIGLLVPLRPGDAYLLHVLPGICLFGLGLSLTVAPLTTTVMTSVADQDSGIASGINNAVSRVAGLIIIALLGLFGATNSYRFSALLCVGLTASAGVVSFLFIRNKRARRSA